MLVRNDDGWHGEPQESPIVNPHVTKFRLPLGRWILLPVAGWELRRLNSGADSPPFRQLDFDCDEIAGCQQGLDVDEVFQGCERKGGR